MVRRKRQRRKRYSERQSKGVDGGVAKGRPARTPFGMGLGQASAVERGEVSFLAPHGSRKQRVERCAPTGLLKYTARDCERLRRHVLACTAGEAAGEAPSWRGEALGVRGRTVLTRSPRPGSRPQAWVPTPSSLSTLGRGRACARA